MGEVRQRVFAHEVSPMPSRTSDSERQRSANWGYDEWWSAKGSETTHIAGLVVLEIADRELAIEAVVVLFGELFVPGCGVLVVVAKEPVGV